VRNIACVMQLYLRPTGTDPDARREAAHVPA